MSFRHLQMSELIQKGIADIMLKEIDFPKGCLVTVIRVETSKDCKEAKIYISILPNAFIGKILTLFNKRKSFFKHLICKKLSLKHSPEIEFIIENDYDNI